MSMNYGYNFDPRYGAQMVEPIWGYDDEYVEADSEAVNAQQFWGRRPFFGGPFGFGFGGPFFFRRPFWGWGGWW